MSEQPTILDYLQMEREKNARLEAENALLRARRDELLESNNRFEQRARDAKEGMRHAYASNPYEAHSDSIRWHGRVWPMDMLMDLPRELHVVFEWKRVAKQYEQLKLNIHPDSLQLFEDGSTQKGMSLVLLRRELEK